MAQLEQAFKKYQVTEAECEMYIACEASQVNRHEENGPLAKIIFDIIRWVIIIGDFYTSLFVGMQEGPSGLNPRSNNQTNKLSQSIIKLTLSCKWNLNGIINLIHKSNILAKAPSAYLM